MSKLIAQRADRVLAAICAFVLSNRTLKFWDGLNTFLDAHTWVVFAAAVGVIVFSFLVPVEFLTRRSRHDARADLENKLTKALGQVVDVAVDAGQRPAFVGLHVWRVRWNFRGPPRDWGKRLVRVHRVRLAEADHRPIWMVFSKGQGTIGRAWRDGQSTTHDRTALGTFNDEAAYNSAKATDPDKFGNLSYEDYNRTKNAVAIFASPITTRNNRVVGCVSVDAPSHFAELDSADMGSVLSQVSWSFTKEDLKALS